MRMEDVVAQAMVYSGRHVIGCWVTAQEAWFQTACWGSMTWRAIGLAYIPRVLYEYVMG
jgi:hypothetical protein